MTGSTGLRRFVKGPPAPPGPSDAAAPAPPATPVSSAPTASPAPPAPQAAPAFPAFPIGQAPAGQAQPGAGPGAEEACEFCATPIPAEHGHVADLDQSMLMCACRACYLLFTHSAAGVTPTQMGRGRYRAVPDRYTRDQARPLSPAEWDTLEIPVGLAFFLRSSQGDGDDVTGFYPSPAGATECRLDLQAWDRMAASHPMLAAAAPDVEAILISRGEDGVEYFLVPIDACYELAGRMRLLWRGFDGGSEARQSIADFLDGVRSRARAFSQES